MATQSEKTPRIATRGEMIVFRTSFFADPAKTTALIPLDPMTYPAYTIFDINGTSVQNGVGLQDQSPGYWKADFQVSKTAALSYDLKRWRIEWYFVTNNNRQVNFVEEFDVRDLVITASESREIKKIALGERQFQALLRETTRLTSLKLQLMQGNSAVRINTGGQTVVSGQGSVNGWGGDIKETIEGDSYVYSYLIPDGILSSGCNFNLLWQIQETPTSPINFEFQSLFAVPPSIFQTMSSLRMLIDRFQKRLGKVQAYEDSDLYEYLVQGLSVINGWHPYTNFSLMGMPGGLNSFWIMAAGWWGLNAQHLLETDMSFTFSGQTVTLDYDHTAKLDEAIQRFITYLNEHLTPAKMAIVRASTPVGAFAGRPTRLRSLHNFVYKIDSASGGDFVNLLSQIGLL